MTRLRFLREPERWHISWKDVRDTACFLVFLWGLFWLLEIVGVMRGGPNSTGTLYQAGQSEE